MDNSVHLQGLYGQGDIEISGEGVTIEIGEVRIRIPRDDLREAIEQNGEVDPNYGIELGYTGDNNVVISLLKDPLPYMYVSRKEILEKLTADAGTPKED